MTYTTRFLTVSGLVLALGAVQGHAQTFYPKHIEGRILLQVESHGEAWYLDPLSQRRLYLADGNAAYGALRTFGLGIINEDLERIPIGLEPRFEEKDTDGDGLSDDLEDALGTSKTQADTDGDGYADSMEIEHHFDPSGPGSMPIDREFARALSGRILLQVEAHGEAWYIHPVDGKRYYMSDGEAAYQIMRYLSLGITNNDLGVIPIYESSESASSTCSNSDYACFADAIRDERNVEFELTTNLEFGPLVIITEGTLTHTSLGGGTYRYTNTTHRQHTVRDGVETEVPELSGYVIECTHRDLDEMVAVVERWQAGRFSTEDFNFAHCEDSNGMVYENGTARQR